MKMNYECVRSLIKTIRDTQTLSPNGKPNPLHVRNLYAAQAAKGYSTDEVNAAVLYLVDKNLLRLANGQHFPSTAPRSFTICGITGSGYDYLAAVDSDTIWSKIKKKVGDVDIASVANVISVAAQLLAST